MSISGIQGQLLEVTVVGCSKLKDTEWFSRQDPYVIVEYGSTKNRTRTCTDGGKNPTFQEKFVFTLIEGLREIKVVVWNSNTLKLDDFIGGGTIQLQKVLSQGYDDSSWTIQSKTGRYAGEVRVIMHYANARTSAASYAVSAPPYGRPHASQPPIYYSPPPPPAPAPLTTPTYPPNAASHYPNAASHYPNAASQYSSPSPYPSYPPTSTAYPPSAYPPTQPSPYPPSTHPQPAYPPSSMYPSAPYAPPSQPQSSPYLHPGSYPGQYPPPPY